jgi:ApbE superfamily uncharacterized protein (UPF0280 family)
MAYEPRTYRQWHQASDLVSFRVAVKETDLHVAAALNLKSKATRLVLKYRRKLERYIAGHSAFLTSLNPVPVEENDPDIVKMMASAASLAGVGPMAAVAGAIAELVGNELLAFSPEIIIENGGDIFLRSLKNRVVGIYAGESPLSGKIGIEIAPGDTPCGVCTSSGTVGHSLSFGRADAVTVISPSAALADAGGTATGNRVQTAGDIPEAIEFARQIPGITGVLIIMGKQMGAWGNVKMVATDKA